MLVCDLWVGALVSAKLVLLCAGFRCFGVFASFSGAVLPSDCHAVFAGSHQVDQRAGGEQPAEVFCQSAITHLAEAELELDQREDMLDPRTRLALDAVLFAHLRVGLELGPPAPVDAVGGLWGVLPEDLGLAW